jgi:hypothetical protein
MSSADPPSVVRFRRVLLVITGLKAGLESAGANQSHAACFPRASPRRCWVAGGPRGGHSLLRPVIQ